MQEMRVQPLHQEDAVEKKMATHFQSQKCSPRGRSDIGLFSHCP